MKSSSIILLLFLCALFSCTHPLSNSKINGYRGIWFELGQKSEYGDKYSGALATYTAKHTPMAIYSAAACKTYFVYGGTKSENEKYLLCMIGEYDHKTGMVSKPTVVYDKRGVSDPHDNPTILIDNENYIWVFVSGRGQIRPGFKFKSKKPLDIEEFELIRTEEMTYPQPWNTDYGYFNFFTKYEGHRLLYFETSVDGINWTDDKLLAAIHSKPGEEAGHYQISNVFNKKLIGTFFNRHPAGACDERTDLYYLQTSDFGNTWATAEGIKVRIPVQTVQTPARVIDFSSNRKNIYLKDMGFDRKGNPICLYIKSNGKEPGPESAPYEWCITIFDGNRWESHTVTSSDHNYDMGSLFISDEKWRIVGPTDPGPQKYGVGGELVVWESDDNGESWKKTKKLTEGSKTSHSYVRRPVNYEPPFCFFWADGDSHDFSKSELWFGDFGGNIWKLPYEMEREYGQPLKEK